VEVDEGFIGGPEAGRPGRGAETKSLVVFGVEIVRYAVPDPRRPDHPQAPLEKMRAGRVRMNVVPDASAQTLLPWCARNLKVGSLVITDGWPVYNGLQRSGEPRLCTSAHLAVRERPKDRRVSADGPPHRQQLEAVAPRNAQRCRTPSPSSRLPQRIYLSLQPALLARPGFPPRTRPDGSCGELARVRYALRYGKGRPQCPRTTAKKANASIAFITKSVCSRPSASVCAARKSR